MLNKTLEFLRLADLQPSHEKVRKRSEAATSLVTLISAADNRDILLGCLQGVIGGFVAPVFKQDSPAVDQVYQAIKTLDATLPSELKSNATELRAVAGIAIGELLEGGTEDTPSDMAVLAAMSIKTALSFRPAATDQYIRWMLETLLTASDKVLRAAADQRRKRGTEALERLEDMEEPAEDADLWDEFKPVITSALQEVRDREAINQEELEILWWMFAAFSELEEKPLGSLTALGAAFASGIELAQRALLPPSVTSLAMVKRAAESGRKPEELTAVSLQDASASWSEGISKGFLPPNGGANILVASYPSLLPLTWFCNRLREGNAISKTGKDFKALIGLGVNHSLSPAEWGAQAFRETVLQRFLTDNEES